jgi:hypothetical protein
MWRFKIEGLRLDAVGDEIPGVGYVDAADAGAARAKAGERSVWTQVERVTRVPWDEGVDGFDGVFRWWRRLFKR